MQRLLMGNECIALGAIKAGVKCVCGYPGTPSTEILETVVKENPGDIYVEWSVNEKAAIEVAAGAAYSGVRTLVTMKQVGLNACADPVMCLAYIGIKGGMVLAVADDPGPISSQTEQDTRHFAAFSKLPVFDPSTPEEAYEMIQDAYEYSERYGTPVIFRPTTRICHGYTSLTPAAEIKERPQEGFVKDPRWAIFPKLSYQNHIRLEQRLPQIGADFAAYRFNQLSGQGKKGIAAGGIAYAYAQEVLNELEVDSKVLKVATPQPFPEKLAVEFLQGLEEVLVLEELDPVIERELLRVCGKYHLPTIIKGKLTQDLPFAGEYSAELVKSRLYSFFNLPSPPEPALDLPPLPLRPPVLCAGCPHRASFYAVKQAAKGQEAIFSGDIGCYTLGNAQPLDMVDTCLCMGAGITIAQGLQRANPDCYNFAFIGDSTFFHTGIPGIINAVYNETKIIVIILDNSTTAMTGHQPHPGTGRKASGEIATKIDIAGVLQAIGVKKVIKANPLELSTAVAAVQEAMAFDGVSAVIFAAPCIAISKAQPQLVITEDCTQCRKCIRELGCPAITYAEGRVAIEQSLCYGCGLCAQVCPSAAITVQEASK
ncbi:indolepyruvate ferredoxin oxidoreductase subunit alpha [Candidatus Methanomassiliicoccus intestinalis]|uniref:indolepyruvate ferredoxin oxidoreductase subunit alpha n=1 Tax=Candidatus Methanomassiliicoccus intestinalis TaxID=1406512 RepID=UPI0037DCCDD1